MSKRVKTATFWGAAALLAVLLLSVVFFAGCGRITSPKPEEQQKPDQAVSYRPVINGFYTNGREPGSSFSSLTANYSRIDEISPLWYHLGKNGAISAEVDSDALKIARERGINVLPLVALSPGGRGALTNPEARADGQPYSA